MYLIHLRFFVVKTKRDDKSNHEKEDAEYQKTAETVSLIFSDFCRNKRKSDRNGDNQKNDKKYAEYHFFSLCR